MALWYDEVHADKVRFGLKVLRTLFMDKSEFQTVSVVETEAFGRALLLDDLWMTAEGDEATYHELIAHPPLCTARAIERVLIIGGGDGGTAREVLRHPEVKHIDMVEVDGMVVDACKTHLPAIGRDAWQDPRLHVHIADGIAWVADAADKHYDVIIVDGSDPVGPAVGLFNESFFQNCARILKPHGVLTTQAESPLLMQDVHLDMVRTLQRVFPRVHPYYNAVTIYPGAVWSWVYASFDTDPHDIDLDRARRVEQVSQLYTADLHRGVFLAVPANIRRALGTL